MNLSGIGSLLGVATSLLGPAANPTGAVGSVLSSLLGGGSSGANGPSSAAGGVSNDPFTAVMNLTQDADSLASSGLGSFLGNALQRGGASSLLGRIAGTLA